MFSNFQLFCYFNKSGTFPQRFDLCCFFFNCTSECSLLLHFIIMKNCFLSNKESYLFFMKIKYFQFCNVIRHTSAMQNCNKYKFHFSKVCASLSISRTWIQSHFLCTLRQLQKQRVLDYEIILKNLSPAKKIWKWYISSWHLINCEIRWNIVIAIAVIIMIEWVNIAPIV